MIVPGGHVGARVNEFLDDRGMVVGRRTHQGGVSIPAHGGALRRDEPRTGETLALGTRRHPSIQSRGYGWGLGGQPHWGVLNLRRCRLKRDFGLKTNRRTNKAEIRHEGSEGVPVCKVEASREIASLGGIVEELLHRMPCEKAEMEATITKLGCAR